MGGNQSKGYPDFRLPEAETVWVGQDEGVRGEEEWASQEGRDFSYCGEDWVAAGVDHGVMLLGVPYDAEAYVTALLMAPRSRPTVSTYTVELYRRVPLEIRTLFTILSDEEVNMDMPIPIKVPGRHRLVIRIFNHSSAVAWYYLCAMGWWVRRAPYPLV